MAFLYRVPLGSCPSDHPLCPIGAPGELLIEGPLLARGYLNDARKTAAAFITDPAWVSRYGLGEGRRMYRTGDLVRQNPDGSFTYIGRKDTQIKIRGQRVELGEIEHHVIQHATVQNAVILYPRRGLCQSRLVGLLALHDFVSGGGHGSNIQLVDMAHRSAVSLQIAQVSQHISDHVMQYMVPSVWIPLAIIPMTSSGKVDRLKLTQWVEAMDQQTMAMLTGLSEDDQSAVPASLLEHQLQRIWSQVLDLPLERTRFDRSFLSLGGDSITAMQVVSQCHSQGILLSVREVLQSKALSQLALKARSAQDVTWSTEDIFDQPFAMSPIQQLYFDSIAPQGSLITGENRFNQSVCLQLEWHIDVHELGRALEVVVAKHAMLRARFYHDGSEGWKQTISGDLTGAYRFQVHRIQGLGQIEEIAGRSQGCLDLEHGPVFSADLIEMEGSNQRVFLTAHHLVIDLMSWRIILHELEELLQNPEIGNFKVPPFPDLVSSTG